MENKLEKSIKWLFGEKGFNQIENCTNEVELEKVLKFLIKDRFDFPQEKD